MPHVQWGLRKPEEGVKSPGVGVAGGYVLPGMGAWKGGLLEESMYL